MRQVLTISVLAIAAALASAHCDDDGNEETSGGWGGSVPCGSEPAAPECSTLCQQVCARLTDCGVSWSTTCLADCYQAYACPGETVGQDAAICNGATAALQGLDCLAYCQEATSGGWTSTWGGPCDFGGGGAGGVGGAGGAAVGGAAGTGGAT